MCISKWHSFLKDLKKIIKMAQLPNGTLHTHVSKDIAQTQIKHMSFRMRRENNALFSFLKPEIVTLNRKTARKTDLDNVRRLLNALKKERTN